MPVAITAPGKSGVKIEMYSISRGGGKIIISSVEDCTVLPLARELAHFVGRYQEVAKGAGGGKTLAPRKLAGVPLVIAYRVFVVDGVIAFQAGNASARVVRLPTRISLILYPAPRIHRRPASRSGTHRSCAQGCSPSPTGSIDCVPRKPRP